MKTNYLRNKSIPHSLSRLSQQFQYLLLFLGTGCYKCVRRRKRRRPSWFWANDKEVLRKWLNKLADGHKRLAGKTMEILLATVGSFAGNTLRIVRFLGKVVEFFLKYIWLLIVCVAGLIKVWLMQKLKSIHKVDIRIL